MAEKITSTDKYTIYSMTHEEYLDAVCETLNVTPEQCDLQCFDGRWECCGDDMPWTYLADEFYAKEDYAVPAHAIIDGAEGFIAELPEGWTA